MVQQVSSQVPPRSRPVRVSVTARPVMVVYAVIASWRAAMATPLLTSSTPLICVPGGKPVMAVPWYSPMLPLITDTPVLVIVVVARRANDDPVPRLRA